MPKIQAIGTAILKRRPLPKEKLETSEIIKVARGKDLGVTFPMKDADQKVQAVRLVGNASDLGLTAGEILYAYHEDFLVNGKPWVLSPAQSTAKKSVGLLDWLFRREAKGKKVYKPPMENGDRHLIVLDDEALPTSQMECYDSNNILLWSKPCLARGQKADWGVYSGDTPVGLYHLGQVWIADPSDAGTCKPYGIHCFDLVSYEDGEDPVDRAGICLHGGGSALGYPGCIDDWQELVATFGCIRMHNADLRDTIYPMWQKCDRSGNRIWVSVYQL